jgi:hypothetical protein
MKSLVDSINGGDLSSAKTAFDALQKKPSSVSASSGASDATAKTGTSQRDEEMAAIGKALDSGDADAAKQALAKMQQDRKDAMQARSQSGQTQDAQRSQGTHGHHKHAHHTESSTSDAGTTKSLSDTTNAENLTYSPSSSATQTSVVGSTINVTA